MRVRTEIFIIYFKMSLSRRKKSQNFLPLIEKKKKKNTRENILTKKTLLYFILSENGIEPHPFAERKFAQF